MSDPVSPGPHGELVIRTIAMPADTNANGPASDVVELRQVEILAR